METQPVTHNTFVIERTYSTTPERVFAALADPAKKRRWFAEGQTHAVEQFEMDFRVGGTERVQSRFKAGSPFPGVTLTNDSIYLDIVPVRRVVISSTMALGDKRFSASLATFELVPKENATNLIFTHQGAFFEGADGPEMRQAGWKTILAKFADSLATA